MAPGRRTSNGSNGSRTPNPQDASAVREGKTKASGPPANEETPRTKKSKAAVVTEDDAAEANYVHPVEEATRDAVDVQEHQAQARKKRIAEEPLSDPEVWMAEASQPSWANYEDDGADHDFSEWRKAFEELRRKRKPEARRGDPSIKPTADELLRMLRKAVDDGDWTSLTAPASLPRPADMVTAVRQLSDQDVVAAVRGLTERHELRPRERPATWSWLVQILERRGEALTRRQNAAEVLRPLLRDLVKRIGPDSRSQEAGACLGKWRMAASLAAARREVRSRAAASAKRSAKAAAAAAAEPEASSEEDDDAELDAEEDEEEVADEDEESEEPVKAKTAAKTQKPRVADSDDE